MCCSTVRTLDATYLKILNEICYLLREYAEPCKMAINRLKIRRPQGRGGSSPPLGTIKSARSPWAEPGISRLIGYEFAGWYTFSAEIKANRDKEFQ